jgi:hypothetical protein
MAGLQPIIRFLGAVCQPQERASDSVILPSEGESVNSLIYSSLILLGSRLSHTGHHRLKLMLTAQRSLPGRLVKSIFPLTSTEVLITNDHEIMTITTSSDVSLSLSLSLSPYLSPYLFLSL